MAFWDRIHAPRRADWGGSTMSDSMANDPFYARAEPVQRTVPVRAPEAPAAAQAPAMDPDGGLRGAMGQALGGYEGETVPGGNPHADRAYWDAVNGRGAAYYGGGQSTDPSWVRNPIHDYEGGTNFVGPTMDELLGVGARPIQMPARRPGRPRRSAGTGTGATPYSNRNATPSADQSRYPLVEGPYADSSGMGYADPTAAPLVGTEMSAPPAIPRGWRVRTDVAPKGFSTGGGHVMYDPTTGQYYVYY